MHVVLEVMIMRTPVWVTRECVCICCKQLVGHESSKVSLWVSKSGIQLSMSTVHLSSQEKAAGHVSLILFWWSIYFLVADLNWPEPNLAASASSSFAREYCRYHRYHHNEERRVHQSMARELKWYLVVNDDDGQEGQTQSLPECIFLCQEEERIKSHDRLSAWISTWMIITHCIEERTKVAEVLVILCRKWRERPASMRLHFSLKNLVPLLFSRYWDCFFLISDPPLPLWKRLEADRDIMTESRGRDEWVGGILCVKRLDRDYYY